MKEVTSQHLIIRAFITHKVEVIQISKSMHWVEDEHLQNISKGTIYMLVSCMAGEEKDIGKK